VVKRKKRRKKSPVTAPSSIRGGEKWRVAGLLGNLRGILKDFKTLSIHERSALESIEIQLDSVITKWIDKEPAR